MSEEKHLTIQEVNIMYDEILSLRAALATVEQENAELKARLSAMHALDPDGDFPSYGELALMFSEKCNALAAAQGEVERMREVIEIMIQFIPDGWEMPLGWNQVVAKAQEAIGGKP